MTLHQKNFTITITVRCNWLYYIELPWVIICKVEKPQKWHRWPSCDSANLDQWLERHQFMKQKTTIFPTMEVRGSVCTIAFNTLSQQNTPSSIKATIFSIAFCRKDLKAVLMTQILLGNNSKYTFIFLRHLMFCIIQYSYDSLEKDWSLESIILIFSTHLLCCKN